MRRSVAALGAGGSIARAACTSSEGLPQAAVVRRQLVGKQGQGQHTVHSERRWAAAAGVAAAEQLCGALGRRRAAADTHKDSQQQQSSSGFGW
jgi:hypothetical protein